jgi:hypothetical protein
MAMTAGLEFRGRLIIETFDLERRTNRFVANNTVCVNGLSDVAACIAYLGVEDIAEEIGTEPCVITPIYGAIGNGDVIATPPAVSDYQLLNEISRTTATASGFAPALGSNPGQAVWQFQFPINNSGADFTLTEAGVFVLAENITNSGDLFDHAEFNPVATWPAAQSLILSLQLSLYAVSW